MIKEAYCNYEMSMLLKEKGFNEYCSGYYKFDKSLGILSKAVINNSALDDDGIDISAPTHQMVLAWLREEKNIIITIQTRYPNNPEITTHPYSFLIEDYSETRDKNRGGKYMTGYSSTAGMDEFLIENDYLKEGLNFGEFLNYEEAIEAALLYTLKNLI